MKTKIKNGFKSVLAYLVTLMILISIMPTAVLESTEVSAAETFRVYFCKGMGDKKWTNDAAGYIYAWDDYDNSLVNTDQSSKHPVEMKYLTGSYEATGYYIHYYDFSSKPRGGILFNRGTEWNGNNCQTVNISGDNLQSGYLYYTNGQNGDANSKYNFGYTTYRPLVIAQDNRSMGKDTNIPQNSTAFSKKTDGSRYYAKATFYDYYSDYELQNNKERSTLSTDNTDSNYYYTDGSNEAWKYSVKNIPNFTFNKELSDYYQTANSSTLYPIYFGNFTENNFYFQVFNNKIGSETNSISNGSKLWYQNAASFYYANNSLGRNNNGTLAWSSTANKGKAAAQGLYGKKLSGDSPTGNLLLSDDTTEVPFFNSGWLEGKKIGDSYNVDMPFFKVTETVEGKSVDYWEIDSSKSSEALRMTKDKEGTYYLAETGVGIPGMTDGAIKSTSDFFPFQDSINETNANKYLDKLNYNFGFSVTIPFTIPKTGTVDGKSNGTPITFEFSGDDDLVVYLDGVLVMDIGGDHGAVTGKIDFSGDQNNAGSIVSHIKNGSGEQANKQTLLQSLVPLGLTDVRGDGKTHYLKVFCVERGLLESNVKIKFNLPVKTGTLGFNVENEVTTDAVNDVFKTENFNNNIAMLKFGMGVQFSAADSKNNFGLTNAGNTSSSDYGQSYKLDNSETSTGFNVDNTNKKYSFNLQNGHTVKYTNDFPTTEDYYLKIFEEDSDADIGQIFFNNTGSGKRISDLFNVKWELYQKSQLEVSNSKNDSFGPVSDEVAASSTGSSAAVYNREMKTTSTSPSNGDSDDGYFHFTGGITDPDLVKFINEMQTSTLTITKKIDKPASTDQTFSFAVTFDNVGGLNLEELRNANGEVTGNGVTIPYPSSGVLTLTVKAGQLVSDGNIEISGIPVGTKYTVEEQQTGNYVAGYSDAETDKTITKNGITVEVTNTLQEDDPPEKPDEPDEPELTPEEQAIKNILEDDDYNGKKMILNVAVHWGTVSDELREDVPTSMKLAVFRRPVKLGQERSAWNYNDVLAEIEITNAVSSSGRTEQSKFSATYDAENHITAVTLYEYIPNAVEGDVFEYQVLEYDANNNLITASTGGDYNSDGTIIVSYNASGVDNTKYSVETESTQQTVNGTSYDVLKLSVYNGISKKSADLSVNTGGRGAYTPIVVGFFMLMVAGAAFFVYGGKKLI